MCETGRAATRKASASVGALLGAIGLAGCALAPLGGTTTGATPAATVAVAQPGAVYVLGATGALFAMAPASGHVLWTLNSGPVSGENAPFIDGAGQGALYLTVQNNGTPGPAIGHVEAVSLTSRRALWTTHLAVQYLALQSGVVYVSDATGIAALNGVNDARYWHYDTPQAYPTAFAIADGVIYLAYQASGVNTFLDAISAGSGALLWRHTLEGAVADSVVIAGGRVLAVSSALSSFWRYVDTFDAATGAPGWRQSLETAVVDLTITGNAVYLHTSGPDVSGSVGVYSLASGAKLFSPGQQASCYVAGPLLTSAVAYLACSRLGQGASDIEAYTARTGAATWKTPVPGDTVGIAASDDGLIFAQSYSESGGQTVTVALNAASGAIAWKKGGVLAAAAGGMAYLVGSGVVVAIRDTTGAPAWSLGGMGASVTALAV